MKPSAFRLLSGEDAMSDYIMDNPNKHSLFCKTCGIHAFHKGNIPELGGEFVSINVACLDDATIKELSEVRIQYCDGKTNSWWNEPSKEEMKYM